MRYDSFFALPCRSPLLIESALLNLSPRYFIRSTGHTIKQCDAFYTFSHHRFDLRRESERIEAVILDHWDLVTFLFSGSTMDLVKMQSERTRALAQAERRSGKKYRVSELAVQIGVFFDKFEVDSFVAKIMMISFFIYEWSKMKNSAQSEWDKT